MTKRYPSTACLMALVLLYIGIQAVADETLFPKLSGRVVDQAGMLSESTERQLKGAFERHETKTSNQVVIATVDDLGSKTIEQYGYMLGRHWGIGQKDKNNGLILLISKNDRMMRIEVGYGLEGVMTDALASSIVQNTIVPFFKRGDFDGGVMAGSTQILNVLSGKTVEVSRIKSQRNRSGDSDFKIIILLLFFAFFLLMELFDRIMWRRRFPDTPYGNNKDGSSYVGTGYSGGFGGFSGGFSGGGGGFGGGGGGGGW